MSRLAHHTDSCVGRVLRPTPNVWRLPRCSLAEATAHVTAEALA